MHTILLYITIFSAIFMSFNLVTIMYEAYIVKILSKFASIIPVQMLTALLWSSIIIDNIWGMSLALLAVFIFIVVRIWNTPLSEDDEFQYWKEKCTEKSGDGKYYLKADKSVGTFNEEQLKTQFKDYKDKDSEVIEKLWNLSYNGNGNFDNYRDEVRKNFYIYKKTNK